MDYDIPNEGGKGCFDANQSVLPLPDEAGTEGELVVLFDWTVESSESSSGWTEAAGDVLFTILVDLELVDPRLGATNSTPLHLLGHGMGAAVTSEAVERLAEFGVPVDQVVIGSCTNGRLSDLRVAAEILRGRKVAPYVRCIVIPGTQTIYLDALREGLVETFIEAGVAVSTPTCGPCLGGHMGILAAGERCISTTNRNFVGRMGSPQSEVYLAGPAVAAASAVLGRIGSPEEVMG